MGATELTYDEALRQEDKRAVEAIDARTAATLDRIGDFPRLRSLELSGNRNITDFAFLGQLPELRKLYLADIGLTAIPEPVAELAQLETLFIGKNAIADFSPLARLPRLVDLGLEEMGLRKIPDAVIALDGLKVLGLFGNSIASIAALKKLPQLEELYVADNKLKKIPKDLERLAELRKLDVMHNYALSDRSVLERLVQLEELSLTNAHALGEIPAGIFALPNLRRLTIAIHWNAPADELEGIAQIDQLAQLEQLTIHGASFTRLPETIGALEQLERLDLSDNKKLRDIAALRDLPRLAELDLSKCDIRAVPDGFSTLTALKQLDLSHNKKLEDISGLRDLPALEQLKLFSQLPALPESLGTLKRLVTLELSARAKDVGFLAHLERLEELYIADCTFSALPAELRRLRKLTIHQRKKRGDDAYLASYPELEQLKVSQHSFSLPLLPRLRQLSVGRIADTLELDNLAALPDLEQLAIHRSDTITALPQTVGGAKGVKRLTLEFLKALTDISALEGLSQLEQLSVRYCAKLAALPPQLATLGRLRRLTLYALESLEELSVIGELSGLRELELERIERLETLPASLARLEQLERVTLEDLERLKDISVLEQLPRLAELRCHDCGALSRKAIARVEEAIAARAGGGAALATSYAQFIASGRHEQLDGKEDAARTYDFPLWIDVPERLLEAMEDFSWLDDHRDDGGELGAILDDPESALKPLAILDFGAEGCEEKEIDAYAEEVFLVDTASPRNPVLIWGHDGAPEPLHDSFDDFLASLRDFRPEKEEDDESDDEAAQQLTYLEYVDEKSSKFWQIVVDGAEHEVTYGKIGKKGQSKRKAFADSAAAQKDAERLIASKLKKGYAEKPKA